MQPHYSHFIARRTLRKLLARTKTVFRSQFAVCRTKSARIRNGVFNGSCVDICEYKFLVFLFTTSPFFLRCFIISNIFGQVYQGNCSYRHGRLHCNYPNIVKHWVKTMQKFLPNKFANIAARGARENV